MQNDSLANATSASAATTVEAKQAAKILSSPMPSIHTGPRFVGLPHVPAVKRDLVSGDKVKDTQVVLNATENFVHRWNQKACEPLINTRCKKDDYAEKLTLRVCYTLLRTA